MNIQEFAEKLHNNFNAVLYAVGGCVRDEIMNKQSKDIDCEVYHITISDFTKFIIEME